MTGPGIDDALRELGLPPSPTADEAKRAYLRTIKTRKPEVDPQGFQRARAAYEAVCAWLAAGPALQSTVLSALGPPLGSTLDEPAAPRQSAEERAAEAAFKAAASIEEPSEWPAVRAAFELARAHPDAGTPPVLVGIETTLALFASERPDDARTLLGAMDAWLATVPSEASAVPSEVSPRLALARDLRSAAQRLPARVVARAARGLALGDDVPAIRAIRGQARRDRAAATALAAELQGSPFSEAWSHLDAPRMPEPTPPGDEFPPPLAQRPRVLVGLVVLWVVLVLLGVKVFA